MSGLDMLHPGRLWVLAVVALLAASYVGVQRYRRVALDRYADAALQHLVVPDRASRRRHLPVVMVLTALAVLVVAVAQPTRAEAVAREHGVVVLAVDVSASMASTDVRPSRIAAAIAGAAAFVDDIPDGIHVGLVAFDGGARVLVTPTTDHAAVLDAVGALTIGRGTAAGEGIHASLDAVEAALAPGTLDAGRAAGGGPPAAVVLLSDGATTVGRPVEHAAAAAAELGIPVTTIAFGTPNGTVTVQGEVVAVPADIPTMAAVARATGGSFFEASTAGELQDVYADIRTVVGTTTEQREITRAAVGLALALTVAAVALATSWSNRAL
jgi:Ca-activated chloride channel homolog